MATDPGEQAEDKPDASEEKTFEELIREAPTLEEVASGSLTVLTGLALRSEQEGMFLLALPGGPTLQLQTSAVRSYRIVQEIGSQRWVQIEVRTERLSNAAILTLAQCSAVTAGGSATGFPPGQDPIAIGPTHATHDMLAFPAGHPTHAAHDTPPSQLFLAGHPTHAAHDNLFSSQLFLKGPTFAGHDHLPAPMFLAGHTTHLGWDQLASSAFVSANFGNSGLTPFVMATPHHAPHAESIQQGSPEPSGE